MCGGYYADGSHSFNMLEAVKSANFKYTNTEVHPLHFSKAQDKTLNQQALGRWFSW